MQSVNLFYHARQCCVNAAVGVFILTSAGLAWADSIAGSDKFICAAGHVTVCASDGSCENTSTAEMDIPEFIIVDLKNKKMRTTEASGANRTSDISTQLRESGKLHFQGSQAGRTLSANVSEQTGDAAFAIVLDNAIIGVFAACTPLPIN